MLVIGNHAKPFDYIHTCMYIATYIINMTSDACALLARTDKGHNNSKLYCSVEKREHDQLFAQEILS